MLRYVISVFDIQDKDIHSGLIDNDTGAVNVLVSYSVVLLRPFKNEVLDCIVTVSCLEHSCCCHYDGHSTCYY